MDDFISVKIATEYNGTLSRVTGQLNHSDKGDDWLSTAHLLALKTTTADASSKSIISGTRGLINGLATVGAESNLSHGVGVGLSSLFPQSLPGTPANKVWPSS